MLKNIKNKGYNMPSKGNKKKRSFRFWASLTTLQITLIIVFVSCGITVAYLTARESVTNTFILAKQDIVIDEPNVPDKSSVEWGENSKNIKIKAESDNVSVYVRVTLIPSVKDGRGSVLPFNFGVLSAPSSAGILSVGDFTLHFNPNWEESWFFKDGYFYYKHILNSGEETPLLLKGVTLTNDTPEIREKYRSLTVNIDALAGSIQSKGEKVLEWGVQLDVDGVTLKKS